MNKALIFDLGRVLVEYDQQQMLDSLASVCQVDTQKLRALFGPVAQQLDTGRMGASEFHRYLIEQAGATKDYQQFEVAFCASLERNEFALRYVTQLRSRGIKIGVISNTNQGHTTHLRRILPELAMFDDVILSNEVGLRKPDAEIFQLALKNLSITAQDAIFVDDIAENVTGAESVGILGIVHTSWENTLPRIEQSIG